MKLNKWLDQEPGRTKALAEHFGITLSAVSQWRTNGVPKNKMLEVELFTNGEVTVREMLQQLSTPEPTKEA